jgi:hypothetical protein
MSILAMILNAKSAFIDPHKPSTWDPPPLPSPQTPLEARTKRTLLFRADREKEATKFHLFPKTSEQVNKTSE